MARKQLTAFGSTQVFVVAIGCLDDHVAKDGVIRARFDLLNQVLGIHNHSKQESRILAIGRVFEHVRIAAGSIGQRKSDHGSAGGFGYFSQVAGIDGSLDDRVRRRRPELELAVSRGCQCWSNCASAWLAFIPSKLGTRVTVYADDLNHALGRRQRQPASSSNLPFGVAADVIHTHAHRGTIVEAHVILSYLGCRPLAARQESLAKGIHRSASPKLGGDDVVGITAELHTKGPSRGLESVSNCGRNGCSRNGRVSPLSSGDLSSQRCHERNRKKTVFHICLLRVSQLSLA